MVPIDVHENEKVLLKLRKHWIILLRDTAATALLAVMPFVVFGVVSLVAPISLSFTGFVPFGALVSALWLLAVWMTLAVLWTNWYLDLWVVTDQRVVSVDQIGLFNRKITTLSLENVQEITVRTENIFETFLHYGTISIETASAENDVVMDGIPHPERIRTLLLDQANSLRNLVQENQQKDELLHTVSHEVKNYLAKDAAALAEIVEGDVKNPGMLKSVASQALSETRKGVKEMMGMLDSPGGTLALSAQPFDLQKTVLALGRDYELPAHKKGLSFQVNASRPAIVNGDEEKLSRLVIKNLLENAMKYTPGGSIAMTLEKDGTVARLTIADTGVGLTPEDAEKLFTPGGRGEDSRETNPESTGFGLAIAKQVVEAHGGRIWAASAGKGQGSSFIVELPAS